MSKTVSEMGQAMQNFIGSTAEFGVHNTPQGRKFRGFP
jgi:hypothetical protein